MSTREGNTQESCSNPEYIRVYQILRICCIIQMERLHTFQIDLDIASNQSIYICRAPEHIARSTEQMTSRHGTQPSGFSFVLQIMMQMQQCDCAYACVSNYPSTSCFQQRLLYLRRWVWYLDRSPSQMQLDMPFR